MLASLFYWLATSSAGAAAPCLSSDTTLCLGNSRFTIEATAYPSLGDAVKGRSTPLTANAGAFSFRASQDLDVAVKVLDGAGLNGKIWVFYGGLTTFNFSVKVTDTTTGAVKVYNSPPASFGDTGAFPRLRTSNLRADLVPRCHVESPTPAIHVGDEVRFRDDSLGSPDKWGWLFGDELVSNNGGYSDTRKDPTHRYISDTGSYPFSVRLSVSRTSDVSTQNHPAVECTQVQVLPPCGLTFSPDPGTFPSFNPIAGSGSRIMVGSSDPSCEWSVTSSQPSYLTIASPPGGHGKGSAPVNFQFTANNSTLFRSAALTFTVGSFVKTFLLSQKGMPCDFALDPPQDSFGAQGGTKTVKVTPNFPNCQWTAVSGSPGYISVTGNGRGIGTFSYSVSPNPTGTSRQGILTVQGKPFIIGQAGCTAASNLSSPQVVGPRSAFSSLRVNASSSLCDWDATTGRKFLSILSTKPFVGTRDLSLYIDQNTSSLSRTDSLTVAAEKTQVLQKGCTSAAPTFVDLGREIMGTIRVTAPDDCHWLAESNASFIHIAGEPQVRTGSGQVDFSVDDTGGAERLGTLTVGGDMVIVKQSGEQPPRACAQLSGPTVAGMFDPLGGVGHLTVKPADGCDWQVETNATFLKIRKDNASSVSFCTAANRGGLRAGRLTLSQQPPPGVSTFDVVQTAPDGGDPTLACLGSDPNAVCLHDGRFEVRATFGDVPGFRKAAHAVTVTGAKGSGYFWVSNSSNPELVVKVIDQQDGHFEVYSGALTDQPYTLTVTDTTTGRQTFFCNLNGSFQSFVDTTTFTDNP